MSAIFASTSSLRPFFQNIKLALLVDGGVEEEGQNGSGGSVDCHADRGGAVAEVEAAVQLFGIVKAGDGDARVAHLAVDVGTLRRVIAVKCYGVEGGGEAFGRHAE